MMDVTQYLIYLPTEEILICLPCKYGLQPKGIEGHLRRTHIAIPLSIRNTLVTYSKTIALRDPSTITQPTDIVPGFDCLELIKGLRCLKCGELSATIESIKKHCNRMHGWTEQQGYHYRILF